MGLGLVSDANQRTLIFEKVALLGFPSQDELGNISNGSFLDP